MRGIEALLLAAFLGLVGLGIWNGRQWFPQWNGASSIRANPAAANQVAGEFAKLAAKPNTTAKHRFGHIADPNFPVLKTEVDIAAWHPAFPTVADLPVGVSATQIRTKYGEPTARITGLQTGHLVEQYYYFNPDRTRLTVAKLDGGVLVSAQSVSR
ncbi:MAG: hypothetical protein JO033_06690 [Acidobacteriaceae bacterium]|nr:hypothetical protein [Acidobacteriaceae bacterium]MBV9500258.1 hypothetical protein [Acidobacteriaceae bacterium]